MLHQKTDKCPCLGGIICSNKYATCQFRWPHGLRPGPTAARLLLMRVRIRPRAWVSLSCNYCVVSGRVLCDGSITNYSREFLPNEVFLSRIAEPHRGGQGPQLLSRHQKDVQFLWLIFRIRSIIMLSEVNFIRLVKHKSDDKYYYSYWKLFTHEPNFLTVPLLSYHYWFNVWRGISFDMPDSYMY
jgi:hypothetical protein